ncbi:hypothetical protein CHARACLAT_027072 [Characodon lateralis]|uniref:Uncharacterized protein n=1 Tax=Characodon lateralis TaxID=208331 RepID=A0ABU7DWN1_9TELE|nr:hypothetical protein [Characodon lateralis]
MQHLQVAADESEASTSSSSSEQTTAEFCFNCSFMEIFLVLFWVPSDLCVLWSLVIFALVLFSSLSCAADARSVIQTHLFLQRSVTPHWILMLLLRAPAMPPLIFVSITDFHRIGPASCMCLGCLPPQNRTVMLVYLDFILIWFHLV